MEIEDIEESLRAPCTGCGGTGVAPIFETLTVWRYCWPCAGTGRRDIQLMDAQSEAFMYLIKKARMLITSKVPPPYRSIANE